MGPHNEIAAYIISIFPFSVMRGIVHLRFESLSTYQGSSIHKTLTGKFLGGWQENDRGRKL